MGYLDTPCNIININPQKELLLCSQSRDNKGIARSKLKEIS